MRLFRGLTVPVLIALAAASPGWARVVTIEGSATVTDTSEASIDVALDQAIAMCLKTAAALGLSSVKLDRVTVRGDQIVVEMLGSDDEEEMPRQPPTDGRPKL